MKQILGYNIPQRDVYQPPPGTLYTNPRSIIERVLFRPKVTVTVKAPVVKLRSREDSHIYGHHPWAKVYRNGTEDWRSEPLPFAPRIPYQDNGPLFTELEYLLKYLYEPLRYSDVKKRTRNWVRYFEVDNQINVEEERLLRWVVDSYLPWHEVVKLQMSGAKERLARSRTRAEASHLRTLRTSHLPENAGESSTLCLSLWFLNAL